MTTRPLRIAVRVPSSPQRRTVDADTPSIAATSEAE